MTDAAYRLMLAVLVAAAGAIAYANTLGNDWVWDDVSSVLLHDHVQDPARWHRLFTEDQHAFAGGQGNFYRPLVALSFGIDFALAHGPVPAPGPDEARPPIPEVNPALFHVTSAAWHILAALGLLAIMAILGAPRFALLLAPLLYVVHPLHTEAVTYISGRADSMAAAFQFWGVAVAIALPTKPWRIPLAGLALALGAAAMLSKESGAMFPVLLLLCATTAVFLLPSSERRTRALSLAPATVGAFVLLALYVTLRSTVLSFGSDSGAPEGGAWQRMVETGQSLALYAHMMVIPTHLHMERSLEWVPSFLGTVGWALIAAMVLGMVAAIRKGAHRIALGLAWFIATWLPISGLIPLNAPMAEHWLYVPMAGLLWALMETLHRVTPEAGQRKLLTVLGVIAALVFLGMTLERNRDWRDNETLFRATLAENPSSLRVHYNLAVTYESQLAEPEAAIRHYERVVELYALQKERAGNMALLWPEELDAHLSLGELYLQQGRVGEAGQNFAAAARGAGDPQFTGMTAMAAYGIGRCMLEAGDALGALQQFQQAVQVRPELGLAIRAHLRGKLPGLYS